MGSSADVLIESKTARNNQLSGMSDSEAQQALMRAKALLFFVWKDQGLATHEQVAEFYEVPAATVRSAASRHKGEFAIDGLREIKGNELKSLLDEGCCTMQQPESTTRLTVWTPRAVLRLGMILRDSTVAREVRNLLVNMAAEGGVNRAIVLKNQVLQQLPVVIPGIQSLIGVSECSTIYTPSEYEQLKSRFRKQNKQGIPGYPHDKIVKEAVLLSARTDNWNFRLEPELITRILNMPRYRYPDLTSQVFAVNVGGEQKSVVFVLDCKDPIVKESDVRECIYDRKYIDLAKKTYKADYAFLILFAPFGADPYAAEYIRTSLPSEYQGLVRVITVRELFEFLNRQTSFAIQNSTRKGQITKQLNSLLNYEVPRVSSSSSGKNLPPEAD